MFTDLSFCLSTSAERTAAAFILAAVLLVSVLNVRASQAQGSEYLEIASLSDLDFGIAAQNTGRYDVGPSYPYIGKFKIRARMTVPSGTYPRVDLTLTPPPALMSPDGDGVPYNMEASTNSTRDDPNSASAISGRSARITLEISEGNESGLPVYSAYVYVYGAVTIGNQSVGAYDAPITIEAEPVRVRPPECDAAPWSRRTRYYPGDVVTHDGAAWRANRFTIGNEPGKAHDWPDEFDEGDDEEDEERGRERGRGLGGDDDDDGNGEPGGGRPWDFVIRCDT